MNLNSTVVAEYAYDAWGKVLSVTGPMAVSYTHLDVYKRQTYYQRNFAQMEYTTSGYRPYTVINYTNDTAAPTITSVTGNPTAWTNGNVTLKVNGASDGSGSGLHAQPYSFSTTKGQYSWQASASKTFTSNQTVYVYTRDKLGNIALRSTVTINKIDKTGPSISCLLYTSLPLCLTDVH